MQRPLKRAIISSYQRTGDQGQKCASGFMMNEMVLIGPERLLGEVVELVQDQATIQV
ncbi:MAG: hypothetical protein U5R30_20755 [Deltaproteobacteria bacterium]|nr:hypothetical protein [Deltaproteobacteria bacterium]